MRACKSRSTRSMHSVDGPADGSHLDLHPDVRPDQRRNHGQPEHRLVRDDFRSHPRIRRDVGGVGKPLADADDIGERGAGTVERLLDVPPGLCDFLGEIFGQCSVGAQARTASA
jgi:hypothetical protein